MLIAKKCLSVVFVFAVWSLIIYGIYGVIDWGVEKHRENKVKRAGEFLTDCLNTRDNKDKVEIYNKECKKVVGRYDHVFAQDYGNSACEIFFNSREGSVMVREGDLYGFIDPVTGEVLLEPQFVMAWESDPRSGLAACVNDELKLGFVNVETKQMVIPFQFDIDSAYLNPFCRDEYPFFDFVFRDGLSLVPGSNGKVGIINETGEIVVPIEYDDIEVEGFGCLNHSWTELWYSEPLLKVAHRDYNNDYDFEQPVILTRTDSLGITRYGVFDRNGVLNIPVEYDQIAFSSGSDKVRLICQKKGVLSGIDKNGELMEGFYFMDDDYYADGASVLMDPEEKPSPYIQYKTLSGYAVIDTNFRVVIEPDDYWNIEYLGHGIFACGGDDEYSILLKDENFNP